MKLEIFAILLFTSFYFCESYPQLDFSGISKLPSNYNVNEQRVTTLAPEKIALLTLLATNRNARHVKDGMWGSVTSSQSGQSSVVTYAGGMTVSSSSVPCPDPVKPGDYCQIDNKSVNGVHSRLIWKYTGATGKMELSVYVRNSNDPQGSYNLLETVHIN